MVAVPAAKAFITGCAGPRLLHDELSFLRDERPIGLILFKRNCREKPEIEDLVATFRDAVGFDKAFVLIDQEGGRVQRLGPPFWPAYPPGRALGRLGEDEPEEGERAAFLQSRLIAAELSALGISVDALPVLDLQAEGGHEVIGDRAYAASPALVARIGRAAADGLLAGGVLPIAKHIPGHGRAGADSHLELPVVDTGRDTLETEDFQPFIALRDLPMAMTAHVVYRAFDAAHPATISAIMVGEVIRRFIGFDGLLMTDDLSMAALSGGLRDRAAAAFDAGCDVALHCNGVLAEMMAVADASPDLRDEPMRRVAAALEALKPAEAFDPQEGRSELLRLAARAGWPRRAKTVA